MDKLYFIAIIINILTILMIFLAGVLKGFEIKEIEKDLIIWLLLFIFSGPFGTFVTLMVIIIESIEFLYDKISEKPFDN